MSVNLDALSVCGAIHLAEQGKIAVSALKTIANAIEAKWGEVKASGNAEEIIQEFLQYLSAQNPLVEYSKELGLKEPLTIEGLISAHQQLVASQAKVQQLLEALGWALDWIDAVPNDTLLPRMPEFDRDYVNGLVAQPTDTPALEALKAEVARQRTGLRKEHTVQLREAEQSAPCHQ